jgi:SAM-dependent methyltransferase
MSIVEKYDAIADQYSAVDYADAAAYYRRRAELVVTHGPLLDRGSTLLDIACGDGGLGRALVEHGIDYHGVDASSRMVDVARRSLGDRVAVATFDYRPPAPVDATTIFRSLYLVPDRLGFLRGVREYTRTKLVFDFDPRASSSADVLGDVREAGWERVQIRPFLMPQRARLPRLLQALLWAVEPLPAARSLTKIRFPILVSASRWA